MEEEKNIDLEAR